MVARAKVWSVSYGFPETWQCSVTEGGCDNGIHGYDPTWYLRTANAMLAKLAALRVSGPMEAVSTPGNTRVKDTVEDSTILDKYPPEQYPNVVVCLAENPHFAGLFLARMYITALLVASGNTFPPQVYIYIYIQYISRHLKRYDPRSPSFYVIASRVHIQHPRALHSTAAQHTLQRQRQRRTHMAAEGSSSLRSLTAQTPQENGGREGFTRNPRK